MGQRLRVHRLAPEVEHLVEHLLEGSNVLPLASGLHLIVRQTEYLPWNFLNLKDSLEQRVHVARHP